MPGHIHRPRLVVLAALAAPMGLVACQDELVQTARRLPDGANPGTLDCLNPQAQNDLPAGRPFGEADELETAWPLAGFEYGALEGPGLHVAARDTFRVYVNGHLIGESKSARTPVFIPVSLLPGENVIAVSVQAASGTPAALVQLEELERSYVSGGDWKLSLAPEGDWTATGYDDSDWLSVRDLGEIGSLKGCDPPSFPADSGARWIGPDLGATGPVALRKTIRIAPAGFGAATTGGASAEPVSVSTWEELEALATSDQPATILIAEGQHDFRRAAESVQVCPIECSDDPGRTVHRVPTSGYTCANPLVSQSRSERYLRLGSSKTILGLGRGASIRGVGFVLESSQNIILRNLALYDINPHLLEAGDAFTFDAPSRVWIDHVTTKWVSDAFADIYAGTSEATISYSLFDGETPGECGGQERWAMTLTDTQMTIHHSRFDQVSTRAPAAEGAEARLHLFNNVHSNIGDWAVGSDCRAQVLLEGGYFENTDAAIRIGSCSSGTEEGLVNAVSGTNLYRDVVIRSGGTEPHDAVFAPGYEYSIEPVTEAYLRVMSRAGAGSKWALPLALD